MHVSLMTALAPMLALFATRTDLTAQTHLVVPAQYSTTDANHIGDIPGAVDPFRHVTLVGASHLTAMVGTNIEAIEFRRSAANEIFAGGTVSLDVKLSIAPHGTLDCSSVFDNNLGSNQVQVFTGNVTIPTSPAAAGPTVNWTANNTITIQFATPFLYLGGPLCIDITGTPVAAQNVNWWMADAVFEDLTGTTTDLGDGCGTYGGAGSQWSSIEERSLVVGGYAHMIAYGSPYGLAIAVIGPQSNAIALSNFGFTPPGSCALRVFPIDILVPMLFVPDPEPALASRGGRADLELKIPNLPAAQGMTLTTQWFDWTQQATSNAIVWTVAGTTPALDMALVTGHPLETQGNVTVHIAHVLRFAYQ